MSRRRAVLLCGYAVPAVFVAFVTIASLITPNYSQIADTVSDLAAQGRPHAIVTRLGIIACGILMAIFATAVSPLLPKPRRPITGLLLAASGFGVLAGIFQIYRSDPGTEHNLEGKLHNAFAICMVVGLLLSMALTAAAARTNANWRPMFRPSVGLGCIVLALGAVVIVGPHRLQGIVQRGMFIAAFAWVAWLTHRARANIQENGRRADCAKQSESDSTPFQRVAKLQR